MLVAERRVMRGLSEDRVAWYLWTWEQWMQHSRNEGRYPSRAAVAQNGRRFQFDFDEAYDESCRASGAAVQAILDGMVPRLRLAVYVKHSISDQNALRAVYVLRGDPEENYREACAILAVQLNARGLC